MERRAFGIEGPKVVKNIKNIYALGCILLIFRMSFCAQFEALNKNFNRTVSHVMARKITHPTLANLDYAAYTANPLRFDPEQYSPKAPNRKVKPTDCSFGGLLASPCGSIKATPLTLEEQSSALAWEPLQKKLWEIFKTDAFAKIGAAISAEKWADPSVFMPYQEIADAYLHGFGDSTQVWVKIEFKPWVGFLDGMCDENNDGFKVLYGKLLLDKIDNKLITSVIAWIRSEYRIRELSQEEVIDWANVLASYWYPKLNTDIVDMTGQNAWPDNRTEEDIIKELDGLAVKNPLIVIRGVPQGTAVYNVFVVDFPKDSVRVVAPRQIAAEGRAKADTTISRNFTDNNNRFTLELKRNGDYAAWARKDSAFRNELAAKVRELPPSQMGLIGKDGWVFFRKDIDLLNAGDLNNQPIDKKPLPHLLEFKKFLYKRNINLLFVVVPDKSEVYFEKLPATAPKNALTIVNPYERKFLMDAQDAGLEVIDLLPLFLDAKQDDAKHGEPLYQKQDTHWTARGLEIAAEAIASRIKNYAWYPQAAKMQVKYSIKDTMIVRQGDIVDKLAEADRAAYPPLSLMARQVYSPHGALYKPGNAQAPVLLIGDSFTGVFELVDCKGAGVGAHIAERTGLPVDIITSWGGGPQVREKMLRARAKDLPNKRVVVYMMVERDLYNYSQGWAPLNAK